MIREIQEELSVDILKERIQLYGTFEAPAHGKSEGIQVMMTCYMADYEGVLSPESEIEELKWLNYADREQVSAVTQLIFDQLHSENLLK